MSRALLALSDLIYHRPTGEGVTSIETEWTDDFERELKRRFGVGRRKLAKQNEYNDQILAACTAWSHADPYIVKSMLAQESSFEPRAHNRLGFAGIAQLGMAEAKGVGLSTGRSLEQTEDHRRRRTPYPDSAFDFEGDERFDPAKAILGAVKLLERKAHSLDKRVFERFGTPTGDDFQRFVLAAYFAGQVTVQRAVERAYPNGSDGPPRFDDLSGQLRVYAEAIVTRARQHVPVNDEAATALSALIGPFAELVSTAHSFLTSLDEDDALSSTTLGSVERLARIALPDSEDVVGREDPDAETVTAIQRALLYEDYDLGTYGPARDGIDGDFGEATEKAIRRFQRERLAKIIADHPARFDGAGAEDAIEGALDRITLLALDLDVDVEEDEPDEDAVPPLPAPRTTPVASPVGVGHEVTFDAASGKLSMQFGLRMYQAMLPWTWVVHADGTTDGVGFSTTVPSDYGTYLPKGYRPEWPDLTGLVEPDAIEEIGGRRIPVYNFGIKWRGTNFTNCTNSQCAAMFVAAGAKAFSVRERGGAVTRYPFAGEGPTLAVSSGKNGRVRNQSALKVFEQTFVVATHFYGADGTDLWLRGAEGSPSAIAALRLGEVIHTRTKDTEAFKKLRIGDAINSPSHAFMIGDIRYGIWLEDDRRTPSYVIDQSAFIDSNPDPITTNGKKPLVVRGRAPLTHDDADWIADNESTFEARVRTFLSSTSLAIDGEDHNVRIVPVGFRMFSANGSKQTVHGAKRGSRTPVARYGITQPWTDFSKALAWARFYALV